MPRPAIPASFARKKAKILTDLAVPDASYADKSPKGSVDAGIKDLIAELNRYDGLVTTSSCGGRVSVFLEGAGQQKQQQDGVDDDDDDDDGVTGRAAPPGGKGGGSWLFVSHDALLRPGPVSWMEMFKLAAVGAGPGSTTGSRMIRFSFEPMILHVMAASLKHAQPLLSAAINAGFRESGVQSLRNLDDAEACPMVAVRTAGLGLESVIGQVQGGSGTVRDAQGSAEEAVRNEALVTEDYLAMLVRIANERFEANAQRIARFRTSLREAMAAETRREERAEAWEDPEVRRQRKREEGLQIKKQRLSLQRADHVEGNDSSILDTDVDERHYVQEIVE